MVKKLAHTQLIVISIYILLIQYLFVDAMTLTSIEYDENSWVILVGGEHYGSLGHFGGHTSIIPVGVAYSIVRKYVPRERIIVIAQVTECHQWHEQDISAKVAGITDPTRIAKQSEMWEEKKQSFLRFLGPIIEEGGADYDGNMVNFETLFHVLLGERSPQYNKVIEYNPNGKTKVFLSMFGHGSWMGNKDNHFFYFPYPSPTLYNLMQQATRPDFYFPRKSLNNADHTEIDIIRNGNVISTTYVESTLSDKDHEFYSYPSGLNIPIQLDDRILQKIYGSINEYLPLNESTLNLNSLDSTITTTEVTKVIESIVQSASTHPHTGDGNKSSLKPFRIWFDHPRYKDSKPHEAIKNDEKLNRDDATLLHWQFFFRCLDLLFNTNRLKPSMLFIFQQSCGSGGMWQFMNNERYKYFYQVHKWPLYVVYTAEPETSAVGSVWNVFFNMLSHVIDDTILAHTHESEAHTNDSTSLHHEDDGSGSRTRQRPTQYWLRSSTTIKKSRSLSVLTSRSDSGKFDIDAIHKINSIPIEPVPSLFLRSSESTAYFSPRKSRDDNLPEPTTFAEICASISRSNDSTAYAADSMPTLTLIPTLTEFFNAVCESYYKHESTLVHVNFRMTDEERKHYGYQRFGVLGYRSGNDFSDETSGKLYQFSIADLFLKPKMNC
jgi:hypothetical protein